MREVENDPILALAEDETLPDPYPSYEQLRTRRPRFWHEPLGSWVFTRHADCVAVLRDGERFAAARRRVEPVPPGTGGVQALDPPEHTTLRRLLIEALRTRDAAAERMIADRTSTLLARLARLPSFDFVTEFAEPLALSTITDLLGVPEPDVAWFAPVAAATADGMDAGLWPERGEPAKRARAELAALTESWLADPPPGGVVAMIAERADAAGIEPTVLANTLRVLLHAGYSSASKLIGLAAIALLDPAAGNSANAADNGAAGPPDAPHPGFARLLGAEQGRAVEELVRYTSPVQAMARACAADTDVGGVTVRAGQAVTLLLGAANRDPERFPGPDELRLDRHPNPHVGFGRAAHSCLGSAFATAQARVALFILARDHPDARAVGPPAYRRSLTLRSPARFEIALP